MDDPHPVGIVVPKVASPLSLIVDPGSAIVCALDDEGQPVSHNGQVLVYFESNRYGAVNLQDFESQVMVAAGRLRDDAPTVAKALVPVDELQLVGWYRDRDLPLDVVDPVTLTAWRHLRSPSTN